MSGSGSISSATELPGAGGAPSLSIRWFRSLADVVKEPKASGPKELSSAKAFNDDPFLAIHHPEATTTTKSGQPAVVLNTNAVRPGNAPKGNTLNTVLPTSKQEWTEFMKWDSQQLEKAYREALKSPAEAPGKVQVLDDRLFEVDLVAKEIKPIYWPGPTHRVRRGSWFAQTDGKVLPLEEGIADKIEAGYTQSQPWNVNSDQEAPTSHVPIKTKPEAKEDGQVEEKSEEKRSEKENGNESFASTNSDLGNQSANVIKSRKCIIQNDLYVQYHSSTVAWLFSDSMTGNLQRNVISTLSVGENPGGVKLIRGWREAKRIRDKLFRAAKDDTSNDIVQRTMSTGKGIDKNAPGGKTHVTIDKHPEDFDALADGEGDGLAPPPEVKHLVLLVHGIGQKLADYYGSMSCVHDCDTMRKGCKECAATWGLNDASKVTKKANPKALSASKFHVPEDAGVMILPVEWRRSLKIKGLTNEPDARNEEGNCGITTLPDVTLGSVPAIRSMINDVALDVLLYMVPTHCQKIANTLCESLNNQYELFLKRHPNFEKNGGQVSIIGHSLGSVLMFDLLTNQREDEVGGEPLQSGDISYPQLSFRVIRFFTVGSPLGLFLVLKEKQLGIQEDGDVNDDLIALKSGTMYNIFHPADPVAYRLEPVIDHQLSSSKPVSLPHTGAGLMRLRSDLTDISSDFANVASNIVGSIRNGAWKSALFNSAAGNSNHDGTKTEESETPDQKSAKVLKHMNHRWQRLDFQIQEGVLENPYLTALSAHFCYWTEKDVAFFILRELFCKPEDPCQKFDNGMDLD